MGLLALLIVLNLFRGGKTTASIIGIERCSGGDWGIILAFILVCSLMTVGSLKIINREQGLKHKYNKGLAPSDLHFKGKVLLKLLLVSFFGGIVTGALGLGGGTVFNPVLISMGVPPKVSSATGKYMIMFSKASACIVYLIYGQLDMIQGLWLGAWKVIGGTILLHFINKLVTKLSRESIFVFMLVMILMLSGIAVPVFGGIDIHKQLANGKSLWHAESLC